MIEMCREASLVTSEHKELLQQGFTGPGPMQVLSCTYGSHTKTPISMLGTGAGILVLFVPVLHPLKPL